MWFLVELFKIWTKQLSSFILISSIVMQNREYLQIDITLDERNKWKIDLTLLHFQEVESVYCPFVHISILHNNDLRKINKYKCIMLLSEINLNYLLLLFLFRFFFELFCFTFLYPFFKIILLFISSFKIIFLFISSFKKNSHFLKLKYTNK